MYFACYVLMQGRLKQVIQYDGEHFVLRRVASESNECCMQDLLCCLDFLQTFVSFCMYSDTAE